MTIKNLVIALVDLMPIDLRNNIRNIPILKHLQAWILKTWLNNKEFIATISSGPAKGLVFVVHMPQDKLIWLGTFELNFAKTLQQQIQPGWVCYDIGGYKGYYAGIMALRGAKKVFVFEPMPANASKISKLLELNASLPIRLKQMAISDTTGQTVFKIMPEETMGKLEKSSFQPEDKGVSQITVDCNTIDDLIASGFPAPDFIKIDVEGAEEFVLKGAIHLLASKKPVLMIEVHSPAIGKRCLTVLQRFYTSVLVLETGNSPEKNTPEICHYLATN